MFFHVYVMVPGWGFLILPVYPCLRLLQSFPPMVTLWFRQLVDETAIQCFSKMHTVPFTLWLFNIAMENSPFIDDFPIETSIYKGFSMAMLNNQMVQLFHTVSVS